MLSQGGEAFTKTPEFFDKIKAGEFTPNFCTPKTLPLKEDISNLDAKSAVELGQKLQKDNWFHFHACTGSVGSEWGA